MFYNTGLTRYTHRYISDMSVMVPISEFLIGLKI